MDQEKLKPILVITVIVVALGTNFGIYNSSVINNLEPQVVDYLNRTGKGQWISEKKSTVWAVVVSAFTAGTAIGTIFSPIMGECMGRKCGLILSAAFNVVGSLMCSFYLYIFELSLAGRLLQGVGLGTGIPLAAAFITEITPTNYRGKFNALLQIAFGLGDLCGMLFATESLLGSLDRSNYCLAITLVPGSIQIIMLIFSYDTPRHLVLKQRQMSKGEKALHYYQGKEAAVPAMKEILDEKAVKTESGHIDKDSRSTCSKMYSSSAKRPILLAALLLTAAALTGISPVMAYSTSAFINNGLPPYQAQFCTVTLGLCNLIGAIVAMTLMEKLGRKRLLSIGLFGCFASVTVYTIFSCVINYAHQSTKFAYGLVVALDFFLLFYSLVGASANTLAAEICSQKFRSFAVSLANFCLMLFSTILLYLYSPVNDNLGHAWVFLPSSLVSIILGSYLIYSVPETAGKSLSEIKRNFRKLVL